MLLDRLSAGLANLQNKGKHIREWYHSAPVQLPG